MKARVAKNSGAGGQISDLLVGRDDLAKFQTADKRVENYIPLPEGARVRTPGTKFMGTYKDETRPARFLDFEAGGGDTYMLVFNAGVIRFYTDSLVLDGGGLPYEIAHPFTDDQLETIFAAQSNDVIFLASGGVPKRLTRFSDINWVLDDYPYVEGPLRLQNTTKTTTIQASADTGSVTLTASASVFLAGHVGSVWKIDEADFSDPPEWKAIETPIALGQRRRYKGRIYEVVALNSAAGDTGPNPPVHEDGDFFSSGGNVTWRYISNSGGFVKITAVASGTSATATVLTRLPASLITKPSYRWFEAGWSNVRGWPTTVSISDQSLVWYKDNGASTTRPTDIYSFVIDGESDSAVEFTMNAPDGKRVEVMWSMPAGVIIAGCSNHEFLVRGAANIFDRLTNENVRSIPHGTKGSVRHTPALVEGGAVFITKSRRRLAYAKFDATTEQIQFKDFTAYAREMLRSGGMQVVAQLDPHNLIWVRLADGKLVSCTFEPDEEVLGWAMRPMVNGKVLQIGAKQSSDGAITELWLGMERVIDGTTRRYIEVMQPFFEALDPENPTAEGAWFVDCGQVYSGAATTTITGAGHLEGQEIAVICNGQEFARRIVESGGFTIERPMTGVLYGIPMKGRIVSLPFDTQTQAGTTRGSMKSSARVLMHLHESSGGTIAGNDGQAADLFASAGLPFGTPLPAFSGLKRVTIEPSTDLELTLELICDNALPCTLLGWIPDMDVKDL